MSLTQLEAKELLFKPYSQRRLPTRDFLASRWQNREARIRSGARLDPEDFAAIWDEFIPILGGAAHFTVTLDTTAPTGATLVINSAATVTTDHTVTARLHTDDASTTGYQVKIWGNVDNAFDANIQTAEGSSVWFTPTWASGNADVTVELATGEGSKTLSAKIRDDVWNETTTLTDNITVDTTLPVVTIQSGPDVTRISKVSGKRTVTVTWQADVALDQYEVAVVTNSGSARGSGTVILTTNGSTNVSGGSVNATTNVTTTIDGRDLDVASSGDGVKTIKIFGREAASGSWSA